MFTRTELFDYFQDDYTEQQVVEALKAIARYDKSLNPEGEEFPDEITEQLEGAFETVEKVLADSPNLSLAEVKQAAVVEAARNHPEVDTRILQEILYIATERAIAQAATFGQIEQAVFDAANAQLTAEQLEKLRDKNNRQISAWQLIGNDDERINKILEEYGVNSKQQTQEWIETYERVLEDDDEDFDASAYLSELKAVVGEDPAKKSLTKSQSRKVIKHLFQSAREAG
jgi:predicted house-cleaning NTP pyrophosphatase (Maf/HAM1 superfamily)